MARSGARALARFDVEHTPALPTYSGASNRIEPAENEIRQKMFGRRTVSGNRQATLRKWHLTKSEFAGIGFCV